MESDLDRPPGFAKPVKYLTVMNFFGRKRHVLTRFVDGNPTDKRQLLLRGTNEVTTPEVTLNLSEKSVFGIRFLVNTVNKLIKSKQLMVRLRDVDLVAAAAMHQLSLLPGSFDRSATELFLKEPFALGYAVGFAEQACQHLINGDDVKGSSIYLRNIIGCMLGNAAVAESFVSFAISKRGDRVFEGGYEIGLCDMNYWYFSCGEHLPSGLSDFLCDDAKET